MACQCNSCYIENMKTITWTLLIYQLPARPSTQRVFVWRRLKTLGALYLQHSVCLLPHRDALRAQLAELEREIKERKGEVVVLTIELKDAEEAAAIIERFRQQADEEYREFLGQCADFHNELEKERKDHHFNFAELDENQQEIEKLRGWWSKLKDRDYFGAGLRPKAEQALVACEKDFERYGEEVAHAEGIDSEPAKRRPDLPKPADSQGKGRGKKK